MARVSLLEEFDYVFLFGFSLFTTKSEIEKANKQITFTSKFTRSERFLQKFKILKNITGLHHDMLAYRYTLHFTHIIDYIIKIVFYVFYFIVYMCNI